MSKQITTLSYIIPPDTPDFIRVTENQLSRLIKHGLVKQIGTRCVGKDCEPVLAVLEKDSIYGVADSRRRASWFRCYLVD